MTGGTSLCDHFIHIIEWTFELDSDIFQMQLGQ